MIAIEALQLLVGYPPDASLEASGGALEVAWAEERWRVDLESGAAERLEDRPPPSSEALRFDEPVRIATARLARGASLPASASALRSKSTKGGPEVRWGTRQILGFGGRVLGGDASSLLVLHDDTLSLLDATADRRASTALPSGPALDDASARGIRSTSDVLVIGEHVVVATRSTWLVARIADLVHALRGDDFVWSLHLRAPFAGPSAPARTPASGHGIVIGRYVATAPTGDAIAVHRRLWVPLGYEEIERRDGTRVPWHARPADESEVAAKVTVEPLFYVPPPKRISRRLATAWAAAAALAPPDRGTPRNGKDAIALARGSKLEAKQGAYGPMTGAIAHLRGLLSRAPNDEDERRAEAYADFLVGTAWHQGTIYEGTAAVVAPLAGIALDPKTLGRGAICAALGFFAAAAPGTPAQEALEGCVAALLAPPDGLREEEEEPWMRMLVAIGLMRTPQPAWLAALASLEPSVAAALASGKTAFELVAELAP